MQIQTKDLGAVAKKFAKLVKQANKLGLAAPTIDTSKPYVETYRDDWTGQKMVLEYVDVTVTGAPVGLAGYKFLATIDVTGQTPVIRSVPGADEDLPTEFRQTDGTCEHCRTRRYRKDVFVLKHKDGSYIQVGRNCLADFLQTDPAVALSYFRAFDKMHESDEGARGGAGGWTFETPYDAMEILTAAATFIRLWGYASKSKILNEGGMSTAMMVEDFFWDRGKSGAELRKIFAEKKTDTEDETAKGALAWVEGLDADTDFNHNMKAVFETQTLADGTEMITVRHKNLGFACYAVAGYIRSQETAKKNAKRANRHVGTVGKRETFEVKLVDKRTIETFYGISVLYKFEDKDGNILIWFASGNGIDVPVGEFVKIAALVKGHDEYKGLKQTKINRVKVVK